MANSYDRPGAEPFNITHFLIRLVVGAVILGITAALTKNFEISGIWSLIVGAVVLSVLDYLAGRFLGIDASPFGRGITGFLLAAAIIYITQFFVPGYSVNPWGAIIGALVYGIVDLFIPGKGM